MKDTWTVYDDREKNGRIEIAKTGRTVARLYYKDDEALRDALLIAAAPEMLEALNEARLQIEYLHGKFQETGSGNVTLARINAAITKAEGDK